MSDAPADDREDLQEPCPRCKEELGHHQQTNFWTLDTAQVVTQLLPGIGRLKAISAKDESIYVNYCWRTGRVTKYFTVNTDHSHQDFGIPYCLKPWIHRSCWDAQELHELKRQRREPRQGSL